MAQHGEAQGPASTSSCSVACWHHSPALVERHHRPESRRPGAFFACLAMPLLTRRSHMPLRYDRLYLYRGYHGCPSYCWLRIYTAPDRTVVIATEVDDNPGTSMTNMAAHLATEVTRTFGLPLDALVWIEHYPARRVIGGHPRLPASFDLVTFTWTPLGLRAPQWRRVSKEQVEALMGQRLAPQSVAVPRISRRQEAR